MRQLPHIFLRINAFMLWSDAAPIVAGLVAWGLGFKASTAEAPIGFYEAAAQIIPVLLLVLALESRAFEYRPLRLLPRGVSREVYARMTTLERVEYMTRADDTLGAVFRLFYGIPILLAVVVGELAAIRPLMTGQAADGNPRPVLAAIAAGLTMIVWLAIRRQPAAARSASSQQDDDPPLAGGVPSRR